MVAADEAALDNPDLKPFLLKLAQDKIAPRKGLEKVLEYVVRAARASRAFEKHLGSRIPR